MDVYFLRTNRLRKVSFNPYHDHSDLFLDMLWTIIQNPRIRSPLISIVWHFIGSVFHIFLIGSYVCDDFAFSNDPKDESALKGFRSYVTSIRRNQKLNVMTGAIKEKMVISKKKFMHLTGLSNLGKDDHLIGREYLFYECDITDIMVG